MGIAPIMAIAGILMLMKEGKPLTKKEKALQATYFFMHGLDFMQTQQTAANPERFQENNPLLGKHPNNRQVNEHFIATALLHAGVTKMLKGKPRKFFLGSTIAMEAGIVQGNFKAGIRIGF